jgi:hypothetical protein
MILLDAPAARICSVMSIALNLQPGPRVTINNTIECVNWYTI